MWLLLLLVLWWLLVLLLLLLVQRLCWLSLLDLVARQLTPNLSACWSRWHHAVAVLLLLLLYVLLLLPLLLFLLCQCSLHLLPPAAT